MFGNKPTTSNIFTGNQQQQNTNNPLFAGNQPQQQTSNIFTNNPPQQQQSNIFGNNPQQGQQTNIYGGQQQPQQQQTNIFNQQKPVGGGLFNTQQPQQQQSTSNIFTNQQQQQPQQGTNIFTNQPQQSTNIFGQQQQQTNLMQQFSTFSTASDSERVRHQIDQFCRRIDPKNLEQIRIDQLNMFKDHRISDLPDDIKKPIIVLVNNMKELRKFIDGIKKQNEQLDKKAASYCKNVQQKLLKYKEALIQNIQQSNLLEQVKQEVEMIESQVNSFIIPIYNSYSNGKTFNFDSPDEFSSNIAKNILQKMIELNNKLDEIISCQQNNDEQSISERDSATLLVLEQLLSYYQNVSAKVLEFNNHYNLVKRAQIQKLKRQSSYDDMVRRIQQKVNAKLSKDFKSYDLIKEIESILQKREKREQQLNGNYRESTFDRMNERERWGRY